MGGDNTQTLYQNDLTTHRQARNISHFVNVKAMPTIVSHVNLIISNGFIIGHLIQGTGDTYKQQLTMYICSRAVSL